MTITAVGHVKTGVLPPQIEVYVSGAELTGAKSTLYRVLPDASRTIVRGFKDYPTTGPIYVTDFEAPFYTDVRYIVTATTGSVTTTSEASPVVRMCFNTGWLSDPLDPGSGIKVYVVDGGWNEHDRLINQDVFAPMGRSYPIGVTGIRKKPSYTIQLTNPTDDGTATVRTLLEKADPILLRLADPRYGGWSGGYLLTGDWKEQRWANEFAKRSRIFEVSGFEVQSPAASAVINLWTWADVSANYAKWGDLPIAKATWADVLRNPTPGT